MVNAYAAQDYMPYGNSFFCIIEQSWVKKAYIC